ncbi:protein PML-like isoform X2 [Patagioenas fasciata]|uniref:protein PML-like isoform X2 n=1 Tax=Patagioenas fasciata TaxID=372321 RepID=UPI0032E8984C
MAASSPDTPLPGDDFQFILCEGCQQASPNLKLLTCLHTLCLDCLSKNKAMGQCPVCRTPIPQASGIPDMDNLLFTNLQARLSIYKKIVNGVDLCCNNCKEASEFWCSECEEFLCTRCCEAHQRYLRKENHEVKKAADIRAGSAKDFLESTRRTGNFFCSNPTHKNQTVSIYCTKCCKPLCCSCALLDSQHAPFCDIHGETQRRQRELSTITQELKQKRSRFQATQAVLRDKAARLEEMWREMRELIQQRVEQLVQLLRREEEELLGLVEARQERGRRELAGELQRVEGTLRRMEAAERLVEKMSLYATEQEVMDMQPFIRDSLQELQRLQPPATGEREQPRDLSECRARLQALAERVTGHPGTSSKDDNTLILDLEPPRELCQLDRDHHQCPDRGGDMSRTQPTLPALLIQRDEKAEEDHGDTVPPPRSHQDSVASLQEDFSGWARSNIQQVDKFLKMGNRVLQAQQRANRHLVSVTWEIQALSRSLATIASALRPLLQPVVTPVDVPTADADWTLLELVPSSTVQKHEPLVPAAATAPGPSRIPLATSPARSETPSPSSAGECPESRHPSRNKRGGKPSARLQKRRKK